MKKMVQFAVVLGLVCVGSALGVAGTYWITRDAISKREKARLDRALEQIFPGNMDFVLLDDAAEPPDRVFCVKHGPKGIVGYMATGVGQGYSSKLRVLVGLDSKRETIVGIKVLFQQETPGLGARVEEVKTDRTLLKAIQSFLSGSRGETTKESPPWFQERFRRKKVKAVFPGYPEDVRKFDLNKVDAITGATITTRAALTAVGDAIRRINKAVAGGPAPRKDRPVASPAPVERD